MDLFAAARSVYIRGFRNGMRERWPKIASPFQGGAPVPALHRVPVERRLVWHVASLRFFAC